MGIPALFGFLSKKYNGIVINNIPHIDNLYFDLNCLIHPQCHIILKEHENWNNREFLEDLMIKQIKKYMSELIEYISPQKLIYVSIDGSAPLAKIKQQRDRRFKSIKEKQYIKDLKKKYDINTFNTWDTNVITPGTDFMKKLKKELIIYLNHEIKFNGKIIFSSADTAGEGEHKILDYIKTNRTQNEVECIYGLDADLIMLSMASKSDEIYLLRESREHSENLHNFDIVSIKVLKSYLIQEIMKNVIDNNYNEDELIEDFVFYCFMLGNDFLPSIPSIRIRDGSITRLISIYSSILNDLNKYLIVDGSINIDFLLQLFESLSLIESESLKTYTYYDSKPVPKYCGNDLYEEELYNYNNNIGGSKKDLDLGNSDFKYRYYMHYFNICYEEDKDYLNTICKDYIQTMKWIYHYYFKKCIDWKWCYKYYVSPFISDLYQYIKVNPGIVNKLDGFNMNTTPFTATQQLLLVLPIESNHIINKKYQYLQKKDSPILDIYPSKFVEFMDNKRFNWQNIPKLPYINYQKITNIVKEKYVDEDNIIINVT